ncbi:MAG: exo-alpha-sialidase [Chitinophagaceae bacterium]|nr:exo-alpha-sialidase [Chitinophagaceae bacterium]
MKRLSSSYLLLLLAILPLLTSAQTDHVVVFRSGESGYHTFRIPAIIRADNGDLLAFCEGRKNGSGDFGNIDIVMRRSADGGKQWGELQVVAEFNDLQAGNPAPIIDLLNPDHPGRVWLFYNTGNCTEQQMRERMGLKETWYRVSDDHGINWLPPVNITTQVHKHSGNSSLPGDWRSYANTPGHALQIMNGPFKGRLVVAANHSSGPPQGRFRDYRAHAFFSDDFGRTFQLSPDVEYPGSNESMAAELGNGGILLNSRNQSGDQKFRLISRSRDAGSSWDTTYFEKNLIDPVNQGSVLTLGYSGKNAIIAHSHAQDSTRRNNLMLHISRDDGRSWKPYMVIDQALEGASKDYTAYSDLVVFQTNRLGVLFERNGYREIVWKTIDLPRKFIRRKR